jgi:hypothetical protein
MDKFVCNGKVIIGSTRVEAAGPTGPREPPRVDPKVSHQPTNSGLPDLISYIISIRISVFQNLYHGAMLVAVLGR